MLMKLIKAIDDFEECNGKRPAKIYVSKEFLRSVFTVKDRGVKTARWGRFDEIPLEVRDQPELLVLR